MTEDEKSRRVREIAKALAALHGSTVIGRLHGEPVTIASKYGFGLWGHSPESYATAHWAEYRTAAEYVLSLSPRKKI